MRYLPLIFLLLVVCSSQGQNPDSLWRIFNNPDSQVTTRLTSIHRLARYFMYQNPDSAMRLTEQEYALALEQGDSFFLASALNLQGGILSVKNEFAEALDRFHRMLEIRIRLKDTVGTATAYNNIGNIYFYKSDYPKALEYYIRSLHYEQLKGDEEGLATSYINIGSIYALQEEYPRALEYFQQALKLYESHNLLNGMASCYANMGNIYKSIDSTELAHRYFLKSIPLMRRTNDDYNLAVVYGNLADSYRIIGNVDSMFICYDISEDMRATLGDKLGIAKINSNRGAALVELGRYRQAIEHCEKGYAMAESFPSFSEMRDACDCLYRAYKGLNENEQALRAFECVNRMNDSLAYHETLTKLRVMEFRSEAAKDSIHREQEKIRITSALKRRNTQRNILFIAGVLLLLTTGILIVIAQRARKSKAVIKAAKDRADKLLLNILPAEVAKELLEKGKVSASEFQNVAVLFTDFVGFTRTAESMLPQEILEELNLIYQKFDEIVARHGIQKIKSIGDGYMAAGGLPVASHETTRQTVLAALDMQDFVEQHSKDREAAGKPGFQMRAGIHVGDVIAGIVGFRNFQYDIWGDPVNLASRMERYGTAGKVNISRSVFEMIRDEPTFRFEPRGEIEVKNKGRVEMWFVERISP